MKYCNLVACASAVALSAFVSVGTLFASPVSVSADADLPASSINSSYSDYFDSIRENTLSYWTSLNASVSFSDYNFRTCSFDVAFQIPYHSIDFVLGRTYLFRLCTDDDNVLRIYYLAYQPGTFVEYQADFSIVWLDLSNTSSSSSSSVTYRNCYVNYYSDVFSDLSPSIYYSFNPSGSFEYEDNSYVSSLSSSLIYSTTSFVSFNPAINVNGRWAAPPMNDQGTYEDGYSAGAHDGYSSGYGAGYEDGNSAGYSDGFASGNSEGYESGLSVGYSSGYGVGWNEGVQVDADFTVIDIWPLLSAVVTMPFTFLQTGLDWQLFAGTPYSFSVNAFFGSFLVLLLLWKIVSMIIGLWGGKL